MKRFLTAFVVILSAVVFLFSSVARAEEEKSEPNVGYKKGFYIKNDDDTFRLTLGGRLQPKVFWKKEPRNNPKQNISFQMRRAVLDVRSVIHEIVTAGFSLTHAQVTVGANRFATVQVTGATVAVEIIPAFIVEAGMVGLPLDMMSSLSSKGMLFNELPLSAVQDEDANQQTPARPAFGAPDGLGLNFAGEVSKWFYSFSVVGANDDNYALNTNRKMDVGLRTGVNILDAVNPASQTDFECSAKPKLTASVGSIYQGKRTDGNTGAEIGYIWTSSLGAALRWGGFAFTTEGYYRRTHMNTAGTGVYNRRNLTDIGYYAMAGYYIIPKKLEIAAQASQIIRQGPSNDSWEGTGAINYYVFDNNLKLQLVYDITSAFNTPAEAATLNNRQKTQNLSLMMSTFF